MTNQAIAFSLSVLLWLFLAFRFVRALKNRKITNGASLHAWSIYFLCYLIAVFTVDSIKARIDTYFGGLPMTTLVRSLLMLTTAYMFFLAIRHFAPRGQRLERVITLLNGVTIAVCIGLFTWFLSSRLVSTELITYLIKDVRDVMMITWTALIILPIELHIWRSERIRPMKLHRALDLMFFVTFLIVCGTGIALSLFVFFVPSLAPYVWALDRSFTYLSYVLILVLLVPFRWLMPLFYPRQLLLYVRLHRLQKIVKRWSSIQPLHSRLSLNLTHPDEIELAIYQEIIAILDMYPSMGEPGRDLQKKIQRVVETRPQYAELVQTMAAIRG